jgi:uncharacterized protein
LHLVLRHGLRNHAGMDGDITVSHAASVAEIPADDWDRCAGDDNPFLSHAFFSCVEESGSAGARTGWEPHHLVARDSNSSLLGIMPMYAKSHSQGEYVFDHNWADAFERAGGRYYPKLQSAVPFTPVPGARLLLPTTSAPYAALALLQAAEQIATQARVSSVHATFIHPDQVSLFSQAGWLLRTDQQFHWLNRNYRTFEDFLAVLASRKRKAIRKERVQALSNGITIEQLTGSAITEAHWDVFWKFYQDTGSRKWGRPYLTRNCFSLLSEKMADRLLLVMAKRNGNYIAGALNMIGSQALYGRYWGCSEDHPCLHFEVCYYQAIDYAIAHGLGTVEAGAQGTHKLARGYEPVTTWSAHFIVNESFRAAIADYLRRERLQVEAEMEYLGHRLPFRKNDVEEQD